MSVFVYGHALVSFSMVSQLLRPQQSNTCNARLLVIRVCRFNQAYMYYQTCVCTCTTLVQSTEVSRSETQEQSSKLVKQFYFVDTSVPITKREALLSNLIDLLLGATSRLAMLKDGARLLPGPLFFSGSYTLGPGMLSVEEYQKMSETKQKLENSLSQRACANLSKMSIMP